MKKLLAIFLLTVLCTTAFAQKWRQFGLKIETNFTLERNYANDGTTLDGLINPDAYIFFRGGKFIYGEIGFGYSFFKGDFSRKNPDGNYVFHNETVKLHSLMIPVKLMGYIPLGKVVAIEPYAGIIYQPIISISDNTIDFSKKTLEQNMLFANAGLDFKFGPIIIGANYKYGLYTFFTNKEGKKPQFVNICVGFQF